MRERGAHRVTVNKPHRRPEGIFVSRSASPDIAMEVVLNESSEEPWKSYIDDLEVTEEKSRTMDRSEASRVESIRTTGTVSIFDNKSFASSKGDNKLRIGRSQNGFRRNRGRDELKTIDSTNSDNANGYQSNRRPMMPYIGKREEHGRNKRNEGAKRKTKAAVSTKGNDNHRTNIATYNPLHLRRKKTSTPPREKNRSSNALVAASSRENGHLNSNHIKCLFESKGSNLSVFSVEEDGTGPNVFFIFKKD
eukprot:CAMPEP_0204617340 /NCGR_PEP_ID=MMETSP0717-20131115/4334_1 /ASSEMBLY_ACC=CAM_ASM_000666 /TAXON_ID=230516 /ORGANISM="Chaetoceros curvisetus" /LENGTH=249 /DNA_ID=CAMNT_0051630839 /DNA_START=36 /DNA_END=785 /DNA_ORIENTATION=-